MTAPVPANGKSELTAIVFFSGCEESALDTLRFPSLPSPFGITCDGMVAAFDQRPKGVASRVSTLDTRLDAVGFVG